MFLCDLRYVPLWGARQYDPSKERPKEPSIEEQVAALGELIQEGKVRRQGLPAEGHWGKFKSKDKELQASI